MRVLLDTNILLDVLLHRLPWQAAADAIMKAAHDGQLECCVASLTITNIFYVARRQVGHVQAREIACECLTTLEIIDIGRRELELADSFPGLDLEDNLQQAAAIVGSVDAIITRDLTGFADSPVRSLTPQQLLVELQPTPPSP